MFVAVSASTRSSIATIPEISPEMSPEMVGRTSALISTSAPLPRKLAWSVGAPLRRVLEKASVGTWPQPQP
jgi:hypothetical protein